MQEINDGGQAFPVSNPSLLEPCTIAALMRHASGMTMRDYFAAKAMQGIASKPGCTDYEYEAISAYKYADAMIAAGEVK